MEISQREFCEKCGKNRDHKVMCRMLEQDMDMFKVKQPPQEIYLLLSKPWLRPKPYGQSEALLVEGH